MRIALAGVGLVGGSIGLAARERLGAEVFGFDPDAEVLSVAVEHGALDRAAASLDEALAGAETCFLCAPVAALPALVGDVLAAAPGDCVVTDVGSTKRLVTESTDDERFVGGHPVAGAESSGVENARADLFDGAGWYLTPGPRSSGLLYERLHRVLVGLGAHPVAIDAETHDRLLATVSHLPHVLANVLVAQAAGALRGEEEPLPRVGPSFRDATRVAGASTAVWTGIYETNAPAIAAEIDEAVDRLRAVAATLRRGPPDAIEAWNDAAREDRRRLLEAELAGGAVRELRVSVPNRPGVVGRVAVALGRAGVNIVDMALAPAPDMRSGAITLWIAGDHEAARAAELIAELGLPVVEP
ncbi:MAG: prephenate dehydrogenase/arogenate dehydrogenase family protein [Thermoleophilaceae bacterium]|nr:prephenate dehydrogenase/arogenate dehydrogenase family protein [Thermoleophilaceae bacterium]